MLTSLSPCITEEGFRMLPASGIDMKMIRLWHSTAQSNDISAGRSCLLRLYCWHWLLGACILTMYVAWLYGIYVPDLQFTVHDKDSAEYWSCMSEIFPTLLRSCTENSPYDRPFKTVVPLWCHAPFEPEGILRYVDSVQILGTSCLSSESLTLHTVIAVPYLQFFLQSLEFMDRCMVLGFQFQDL
ncbi:hypothetical protein V6N13_147742 [Hibiscus sabdariffa]|uniref:Uncharacterized protein n=1 Tax=Hibiscus sabdariffa TaxID=183260 RepID=A0ABR2TWD0_9ROSI